MNKSILNRRYGQKSTLTELTVSAHPDRDALLEPAVLAAVPVDAQDVALLVLGARPVLDLLLDRATEEALEQRNNNVIEMNDDVSVFM